MTFSNIKQIVVPEGAVKKITYNGATLWERISRYLKTVIGKVVTVTDALNEPAESLKVTLEPIQSGSGTPSPDNVRPISGHTEVDTHRTGKNLFNPNSTDNEWVSVSGEITQGTTTGKSVRVKVSGVSSLTASMSNEASATNILLIATFASDMTLLSRDVITSGKTLTKAIPSNAVMAIVSCYAYGYSGNVQLEIGSTATAYEPYQGNTYTTTLGRTVYGGTLDVVSGELVIDRAMVDLGTLDWTYQSGSTRFYSGGISGTVKAPSSNASTIVALSSIYEYMSLNSLGISTNDHACAVSATRNLYVKDTAFTDVIQLKAYLSGQQFCYELATPQTYQLDPQTISLLHGNNNVWSDGSVELTYWGTEQSN